MNQPIKFHYVQEFKINEPMPTACGRVVKSKFLPEGKYLKGENSGSGMKQIVYVTTFRSLTTCNRCNGKK